MNCATTIERGIKAMFVEIYGVLNKHNTIPVFPCMYASM